MDWATQVAQFAHDPARLLRLAIQMAVELESADAIAARKAQRTEQRRDQRARRQAATGGDNERQAATIGDDVRQAATSPAPPSSSLLSPTPPYNSSPSAPPPAEHKPRAREAVDAEVPTGLLATIAKASTAEEYADVLKFLYSRRAVTRDAWVREMAKLITGTPFTPGDLAGACSDALALEKPIDGPVGLRAFVAKRRDERLKGVSAAPGAATGGARNTFADRQQAEAREKRELDKRAQLDRQYETERAAAVKAATFTDEQQLEVARKVNAIAGTGQFAQLARDAIHKSELAKLAGFPDLDAWLAKRERRTA